MSASSGSCSSTWPASCRCGWPRSRRSCCRSRTATPLTARPSPSACARRASGHAPYGETVAQRLREAGVRVELDQRTESIARKIRDAELRKIPYMAVVGDREEVSEELSLREHGRGDAGSVSVQSFAARVQAEVKSRSAG